MENKNFSSSKVSLIIQVNNLITIYEQKAECGIFFKLNQEKSPLDIIGVLDFLKYKIKKWGNTNLFSYHGDLFNGSTVLVVGARNLEEAISIMIYMFLTKFIDKEYEINNLIKRLGSSNDIEQYLRNNLSKNTKKGYPSNSDLEMELKNHLEGLIKSEHNSTT
ncbi:MAG: hypothetical protein ACFFAQ_02930 [Promethearchaeota archaeon]